MAKLIRATQKLRQADISHIEVHRCLYGYTLYDPRLVRQKSTVYQSIPEAVAGALGGDRPVDTDDSDGTRISDPLNYEPHLRPLHKALFECQDRLSDGFGWYTSSLEGMTAILEKLYTAGLTGRVE